MIRNAGPGRGDLHDDDGVGISPEAAIAIVLRHRLLMILIPLVTAGAALAFALVFREYTARSRFVPQAMSSDLGRLAGIAAQMGVNVGQNDATTSPDFYVDLLGSSEVLRPAVEREYRFAREPGSADTIVGTYLDLIGVDAPTAEQRVQAGIDKLRDRLSASASIKSGVITVRTTAPYAGLAESLNATILELLAGFDRERRQAGAHAERLFIEDRLGAAGEDLRKAENALAAFLDRNARPESPRLAIEMERLQRQVMLRQQVYAGLAEAYEQTRIEEVRNTPVLTVIDRPDGSARAHRGVLVTVAIGFIVGLVAASALVFSIAWFDRRRDSPAMHELRRAVASTGRRSTGAVR
jgi:uncharacterized protein involved in exopolysaccharide biosynthesis